MWTLKCIKKCHIFPCLSCQLWGKHCANPSLSIIANNWELDCGITWKEHVQFAYTPVQFWQTEWKKNWTRKNGMKVAAKMKIKTLIVCTDGESWNTFILFSFSPPTTCEYTYFLSMSLTDTKIKNIYKFALRSKECYNTWKLPAGLKSVSTATYFLVLYIVWLFPGR